MVLAALAGLRPHSACGSGLDTRVRSETNGEIVIEVIDVSARPVNPLVKFFVALPPQGAFSVSFDPGDTAILGDTTSVSPAFLAKLRTRAATAADTVKVSLPFSYRGSRVIYLQVNPFWLIGGLVIVAVNATVTVSYPSAANVHDASTVDPLLRQLVINENVFPYGPATTSLDPWFSLSPNWIKIPVVTRGMYAVTGADLIAELVDVQSIDPASMRMYTSGATEQPVAVGDTMATWRAGVVMNETAILVDDGGDGTFDPADRVVFYGLGPQDWEDYYTPGATDSVFYEHNRAGQNFYYLTWDGGHPGVPRRMMSRGAAPGGSGDITSSRHREYREEDLIAHYDFRGDGWLWHDVQQSGFKVLLSTVSVNNLVASRPQVFRTVALSGNSVSGHHAVYLNTVGGSENVITDFVWNSGMAFFEQGKPVRYEGSFLANGVNQFSLRMPRDLNAKDEILFAWFSVWYDRRLEASSDRLAFTSPDTSATVTFAADGFSTSGTIEAYDVTDPWSPVILTGLGVTTQGAVRRVRLSSIIGGRAHFEITTTDAYRSAPGMFKRVPVDLRADPTGPNMLIIAPRALRAAADRLRLHRLNHLPGYITPEVRVVEMRDIYDNFSGGLPDPMALRNYVKFVYDNYATAEGNHALAYVLLFGDATVDFRNNGSTQLDGVPTNLILESRARFTYATDEVYGLLDAADNNVGMGYMDVALGRVPAETTEEANLAVDKIITYETAAPQEAWRKEVVLVADDTRSSFASCELGWTTQSDVLAEEMLPGFFEVKKVYLVEYDQIGGVKPAARFDLLKHWNDGALVINYIGHGSSQQMADERVFLGSDVNLLHNGLRLPLLTAFSCTIGDFANPVAKSLSEKLIFRSEGGAIATLTASRESFPGNNNNLNNEVYRYLAPPRLGTEVPGLGMNIVQAKLASLLASLNPTQEENNWKYNLLGDPAMQLGIPGEEIRLENSVADTLVAGVRKTIRGAVYVDGAVDASFNGTVRVRIREPVVHRLSRGNPTVCPPLTQLKYRIPGGVLYEGTADVTDGQFEVNFRVPRLMRIGPNAFITAYANAGERDAAVTADSVLTVIAPTPADSTDLRALDGAPRVTLGFKSGLDVVKPGETLQAIVRDADGINILDTTNEGKQAVLFDDLPFAFDVNEFFNYDHGGTDTSGVLLYPLPDLEFGSHRLIYKVSDKFGLIQLDTLFFSVTDPSDFFAEAVFNYPNPFQTTTQFLFRLSDRAMIQLDIYTVSGKRIRRLDAVRDGGEVWIEWDGRDEAADEIANGIYLYVARVEFVGLDRPPLVLRGKVSKIR